MESILRYNSFFKSKKIHLQKLFFNGVWYSSLLDPKVCNTIKIKKKIVIINILSYNIKKLKQECWPSYTPIYFILQFMIININVYKCVIM